MEVLGTVGCDHEYSVIVRLGVHDVLELENATEAYVAMREGTWMGSGRPSPADDDGERRPYDELVEAVRLHGAWSVVAQPARDWLLEASEEE